MSSQQNESMRPWHSLMYSSGMLMSICGVPAIPLAALLLWLKGTVTFPVAIYFSGIMLAFVIPLAASLWLGAIFISKRQAARASGK